MGKTCRSWSPVRALALEAVRMAWKAGQGARCVRGGCERGLSKGMVGEPRSDTRKVEGGDDPQRRQVSRRTDAGAQQERGRPVGPRRDDNLPRAQDLAAGEPDTPHRLAVDHDCVGEFPAQMVRFGRPRAGPR